MSLFYKKKNDALYFFSVSYNDTGALAFVREGKVGEVASSQNILLTFWGRWHLKLKLFMTLYRDYEEVKDEEYSLLIIDYSIDGLGTPIDLEKRHHLEDFVQTILEERGLGTCSGGGSGGDLMEVFCDVTDYEHAKTLIEKALFMTEFSDYKSIY
jgi:hypothetical protein